MDQHDTIIYVHFVLSMLIDDDFHEVSVDNETRNLSLTAKDDHHLLVICLCPRRRLTIAMDQTMAMGFSFLTF